MKKSKLKKITKIVIQEIKSGYDTKAMKEKVNYNDYDPEVSNKVKNMILNIIKFKDNIHINVTDTNISISCSDVSQIKKQRVNSGKVYSDERYLEIIIYKGEGFILNYGYSRRTNYEDINLFDELNTIIKSRLKEINSENFSEIWEALMKYSGVMRDNNLDQLLDE